MSFENIRVEQEGSTAVITINRPDKLNALNRATIAELSEAFDAADSNTEVRAIVITGEGTKAFVAGADISEFASFGVTQGEALSREGHEKLFNKVENLGTPVIAAVNGFALGGGLELAMAAHIRIASDNAKMGLPEVSLGVIPGYGGTQRLPQLIGKGRANQLIFTAGMVKADEAKTWGLVNDVVPQDALMSTCRDLAMRIANNSPAAIRLAIEAVNAGYRDGTDGLAEEVRLFGESFGTDDFKKGTTAFLEKKKPIFSGK